VSRPNITALVERALADPGRGLAVRNLAAVRRVARCVPPPRCRGADGALKCREGASLGGETPSTTSTHSGGQNGCKS